MSRESQAISKTIWSKEKCILELAKGIREGRFRILKIQKMPNRVYRLYLGNMDLPNNYTVEAKDENLIIVRFGVGDKRVARYGKYAFILIPAKYAKGKEGPVLVEWLDSRTLAIYLG